MFDPLCREGGDYPHLPPVEDIPASELAADLRSSPLLSAAADLASWVERQGGIPAGAGDMVGLDWPAPSEFGLSRFAKEQVWRLAKGTSLLRTTDDQITAGDGLDVWRHGAPYEVAMLGLEAFGAAVSGLAAMTSSDLDDLDDLTGVQDETLESVIDDLPFRLFELFENNPDPLSCIRMAADTLGWMTPYHHVPDEQPATPTSAAPPPPAAALLAAQLRRPHGTPPKNDGQLELTIDVTPVVTPGLDIEYQLPPDAEIERQLDLTNFDDDDRTELFDNAYWQALVFDRLAALGLTRRDGERIALTRLGLALTRLAFNLADGTAPTVGELADVDGATMAKWMSLWPYHVQASALLAWANAHRGDATTAWQDLLSASTRGSSRNIFSLFGVPRITGPIPIRRDRPAELPSPLPYPEAESGLCTALGALVADPVIGAYAAETLQLRGQPAGDPPWPARAVRLFDRLESLLFADMRRHLPNEDNEDRTGSRDAVRQPVEVAICSQFDQAAADWPGGVPELVRQLAAARPLNPNGVLDILGDNHPDAAVASAIRAARAGRDPRGATQASSHVPGTRKRKPRAESRKPGPRKHPKKRHR
jgi:hypothetical protein